MGAYATRDSCPMLKNDKKRYRPELAHIHGVRGGGATATAYTRILGSWFIHLKEEKRREEKRRTGRPWLTVVLTPISLSSPLISFLSFFNESTHLFIHLIFFSHSHINHLRSLVDVILSFIAQPITFIHHSLTSVLKLIHPLRPSHLHPWLASSFISAVPSSIDRAC